MFFPCLKYVLTVLIRFDFCIILALSYHSVYALKLVELLIVCFID